MRQEGERSSRARARRQLRTVHTRVDISTSKTSRADVSIDTLKKGFHKIEVKSATPGVGVSSPSGYVR